MSKNKKQIKKNISTLTKNSKFSAVKNFSSNTNRILINSFIKVNPVLNQVIGDDGLKLFNEQERKLKSFSEVKTSTKGLLKSLKDNAKQNDDLFSDSEKLTNEKPEYETVSEIITDSNGEKSEIISIGDKKASTINSTPAIAISNLSLINSKGFANTSISLSNLSVSLQTSNALTMDGINSLNAIFDDMHKSTLLSENTARRKQSLVSDILKGKISLLNFMEEKTNPLKSITDLIGEDMIKSFTDGVSANPIEFAMEQGSKMAWNRILYGDAFSGINGSDANKNSRLYKFNKRFSSENIGSLLINDLENEDSIVNKFTSRLESGRFTNFAGKEINKRLNKYKKLNDFNGQIDVKNKAKKSTPVDFDQETHSTINKAIPEFLSIIQNNLYSKKKGIEDNPDNQLFYHYKKGEWMRKGDVKRNIENKMKNDIHRDLENTGLYQNLKTKNYNNERINEVLYKVREIGSVIKNNEDFDKAFSEIDISKEEQEDLKKYFENSPFNFNNEIYRIKNIVVDNFDKIDKDGSSLQSFIEVLGIKDDSKASISNKERNNIDKTLLWENDDLKEMKGLFSNILSKIKDLKNTDNQTSSLLKFKVDDFNSPSDYPNINIKENLNDKINNVKNKFDNKNGIIENINSPYSLATIIPFLNKGNDIDPNKAPNKTLSEIESESKFRVKEKLENIIKSVFPAEEGIVNDLKDSSSSKFLSKMTNGLNSGEIEESGENAFSKITNTTIGKTKELFKGGELFNFRGGENPGGTRKLTNALLDFGKGNAVRFSLLASGFFAGKFAAKKVKESGLAKTALKGLGVFGGLLGGGALATKLMPNIMKKILPGFAFNALEKLPGQVLNLSKSAFSLAKDYGIQGLKHLGSFTMSKGKSVWNFAKDKGGKLLNLAKDKGSQLKNFAIDKGGKMWNFAKDKGKSVWNFAKDKGSQLKNFAIDKGGKLLNFAKDKGGKLLNFAKDKGGKAITKLGSASKNVFNFAKRTGSKLFNSKIVKLGMKAGAKIGLRGALFAVPVVGTAIGLALNAPEIIKSVSHPIESLKHPIKTLGSFFGLSKHPADSLKEDSEKSEVEKGERSEDELSKLLITITKLMFRASPLMLLSNVGKSTFDTITNSKVRTDEKADKENNREMFSLTPIGQLYELAKGGIDFKKEGASLIGDWFGRFLVKVEDIVVAMSKARANSGSSDGDTTSSISSDGEIGDIDLDNIDMNTPSYRAEDSAKKQLNSEKAGGWLANYPYWQPFGTYRAGFTMGANGNKHYGVDFGMPIGTPVKCIIPGVVQSAEMNHYGGNMITIKSGGNIYSWYCHLSAFKVKKGDRVKTNQVIGFSGATGAYCDGAHLHFQVMRGGVGEEYAINPWPFLKANIKKDNSSFSKAEVSKGKNHGGSMGAIPDDEKTRKEKKKKKTKAIKIMKNVLMKKNNVTNSIIEKAFEKISKSKIKDKVTELKNLKKKADERFKEEKDEQKEKEREDKQSAKGPDEIGQEDLGQVATGASAYSFKNGTWYGSITGRDDNRMDKEEKDSLNDRILRRYSEIFGIDYATAKKELDALDDDKGNSKNSSKGNQETVASLSKSKNNNKSSKDTNNNSNNTSSVINNNSNNASNNNSNNTSSNNSSTISNQIIKGGKNTKKTKYHNIKNNYKNSKVENSNTDYIYDFEKIWYDNGLIKILSSIDKNIINSNKEIERIIQEIS